MKTIRDKIGFTPTRFVIKGSEEVGNWYLPVVKSYVKDFVREADKSGLKQHSGSFTFYDPPARVRVVYHYGTVEVLIDSEPVAPSKKVRKPYDQLGNLLVLCGDEDVGYNVAVFSEGGGNTYFRFSTMSELMAMFPVAEHQQAFRYRYSYVADTTIGVATEGEPIVENYVSGGAKTGQYAVHLTPHTNPLIAGQRCLPANFTLETPYSSELYSTLVAATKCNALDEDTAAVLEQFNYFTVSTDWEMQYTPRMFLLSQNTSQETTRMFDKRDVILSVNGASSITGINTHAWVLKDTFALESVKSKSLYAVSAAREADYSWEENPFFDVTNAVYYGNYMGLFAIQRTESPAGTLLILNDDNLVERIWTLTDSFLAVTNNYLGCGVAEKFIPAFDNAFFNEVDTANAEYKAEEPDAEIIRSYYSFSFPNIIFAGMTHRAPMTETIDAFLGLPVTGMFAEVSGVDGHRPNMTCAKNIASSIIYKGQRLDIYFSTFLEATYTYANSKWAPVESQQVFMGAAKKQIGTEMESYDVLKNLKEAFAQFRTFDLTELRVPALGPHPCAGAAMFYPFERGSNFFAEELACFNLINEYRVEMEVPKLKWDGTLTTAAATHAQDLIDTLATGHEGSDNSQSWHRIMASGVSGWCKQVSAYGEIIAVNSDTAADAIAEWKASLLGHHEALYTKRHIACGIATRTSEATGKIWVITFAGEYTLDTIP